MSLCPSPCSIFLICVLGRRPCACVLGGYPCDCFSILHSSIVYLSRALIQYPCFGMSCVLVLRLGLASCLAILIFDCRAYSVCLCGLLAGIVDTCQCSALALCSYFSPVDSEKHSNDSEKRDSENDSSHDDFRKLQSSGLTEEFAEVIASTPNKMTMK